MHTNTESSNTQGQPQAQINAAHAEIGPKLHAAVFADLFGLKSLDATLWKHGIPRSSALWQQLGCCLLEIMARELDAANFDADEIGADE
jgi:hypothetical protein